MPLEMEKPYRANPYPRLLARIALGVVSACTGAPSNGPPARLIGGIADTVIINHSYEVRIPVRVLDSAGHVLPDSGVRFRLAEGENVAVSSSGKVTCSHSVDARVAASLGGVSTIMLIRCRPLRTVYIAGPIQFLLPDTAQEMRIEARDLDGNAVNLLRGTSEIIDTAVATIDGIRVIPKSPGATVGGVRFGNQSAGVGVHVYEKVNALDALREGKHFVGMVLQLSGGEMQSWHLPPGSWMLTMLPEDDENDGLRLRIEGANCTPLPLTRRRYACLVTTDARVIVFHPSTAYSAPRRTGQLLVRPIYG